MARYDTLTTLDGEAIKARRLTLGLSRSEMVAESGVSESIWQVVEGNARPVSERSAAKILATFDRLESIRDAIHLREDEVTERLRRIEEEREGLRQSVATNAAILESLQEQVQLVLASVEQLASELRAR